MHLAERTSMAVHKRVQRVHLRAVQERRRHLGTQEE